MARTKKDPGLKYPRQNVSFEPDQLRRVMAYCQQEDRSISWIIRQALDLYLNISMCSDTQRN